MHHSLGKRTLWHRLRRWFRRRARLLTTACASAGINVFRFNPTGRKLLDGIVDYASSLLPSVPPVLFHAVFFFTAWAGFYLLVRRVGPSLYKRFRQRQAHIYLGEDRGREQSQQDLIQCLESSGFLYGLLLAGYKMLCEEEEFLLKALTNLRSNHGKDIRFLLLNRESLAWSEAVDQIIRNTPSLSLEVYKGRCEAAEHEIRQIPGVKLHFYDDRPRWRLYLFHERIFVSRYSLPPDSHYLPSNFVPMVSYPRTNPMYDWLFSEFRRHCDTDWQVDLPTTPP